MGLYGNEELDHPWSSVQYIVAPQPLGLEGGFIMSLGLAKLFWISYKSLYEDLITYVNNDDVLISRIACLQSTV